jgi:hypothetical protein
LHGRPIAPCRGGRHWVRGKPRFHPRFPPLLHGGGLPRLTWRLMLTRDWRGRKALDQRNRANLSIDPLAPELRCPNLAQRVRRLTRPHR